MQSFFFFWRGLITLCSYSFWRRSNYFFRQLNGCSLSPGRNFNFLDFQFFPLCEIRPKAADAPITGS